MIDKGEKVEDLLSQLKYHEGAIKQINSRIDSLKRKPILPDKNIFSSPLLQADKLPSKVDIDHNKIEEKYEKVFLCCPDSITLTIFEDGTILEANTGFEKLFGYSREEVMGKTTKELGLWQDKEDRDRLLLLLKKDGYVKGYEVGMQTKKGHKISVLLSMETIELDGKQHIITVISDMTEQKTTLEALKQSELRLRQVAENINEIFWTQDKLSQKFLYISKAYEKITGRPLTELYADPDTWFECVHPDDLERIKKIWDNLDEHNTEYRIFHLDGSLKWIRSRMFPVKNQEGEIYRVVGVASDITQFKEAAEKEKINQEQLIQADKMASLGVLVSGIVHEINNPNNFILPNAEFIYDIWKDVEKLLLDFLEKNGDFDVGGLSFAEEYREIAKMIQGIINGANRINAIVNSLKSYARPSDGQTSNAIDLNRVVNNATLILSNMIKKEIKCFRFEKGEALPFVSGNEQQIEQVVINLISNACQSIDHSEGEIVIKTYFDIEESLLKLSVSDNGVGMTEGQMTQMFNPFYTTKRNQGGTGLGLSISYKIIQDHQGTLSYHSVVGQGTQAVIALPVEETKTR